MRTDEERGADGLARLSESQPKPELNCRQCGQPEAHAVGDEILCAACCHERGSCGAVREVETNESESVPGG